MADKSQNPKAINNVPYWFQNINELIDINKMNQVLPNKDMEYPEKINALVRASWYIGILASLFTINYLFLFIPVLTMVITYILYLFRTDDELKNAKNNNETGYGPLKIKPNQLDNETVAELLKFKNVAGLVTPPTDDNPFMNPMPFDSRLRPPAAPSINDKTIQTAVDISYDKGVWRDVNDIWNKNDGRRQFYTMPNTSYPNDQTAFANWLYKVPLTCKEGNGAQCVANNYTDLTRRVEGSYPSG